MKTTKTPFFIVLLKSVTILLCLFMALQFLMEFVTYTFSVTDTRAQVFESWGTSSAWWSQDIESEELANEIAKALYSKTEGLGLDVYRYNVGAGERDNPNSRIANPRGQTESFYVFSEQTGQWEYNFTRDANARRMLDKAIEQGANQVILFCNSPHYSMTVSAHASGALTEFTTNLAPENYQAFVDYLLTIADWFVEQGYPITGISPINEPMWRWGGDWVGQEGCHMNPEESIALLELFAVTMQERNSPYALFAPESGEMTNNYKHYNDLFFSSEILNEFCDTFSAHSYWITTGQKKKAGERFREMYPDKKFEVSEWCELPMKIDSDSIDSGLYKANIIIEDLTLFNAVSWQSWTAVNNDGVMKRDGDGLHYFTRYWAFRHFSSFIKPEAVRQEMKTPFWRWHKISSLAFEQENERVAVLVNNSRFPKKIRLSGEYETMEIFTTDSEKRCEKVVDGAFQENFTLAPRSINTVVLRLPRP